MHEWENSRLKNRNRTTRMEIARKNDEKVHSDVVTSALKDMCMLNHCLEWDK